jgi:hypothetical protein
MTQTEVYEEVKKIYPDTNYIIIECCRIFNNNKIKTNCRIYISCKNVDDYYSVNGQTFKECLFLLKCKIENLNEEEQDA